MEEGASEDVAPSTKRTKVQSVLDFSPSQYTASVFKANNPFVFVYEQPEYAKQVVKGNKIADGLWMDPGALNQAIKKLIGSSARASVSTGGCIVHVLDLWLLTKPSAPAPGEDEITGLVVEETCRASIESLGDDEDKDDEDYINDDAEETKKMRHGLQLFGHSSRVLNDLVSLMYIECSWDSITKKELYEAGARACAEGAMKNMKKKRYEPIYLEGWGESKWIHGALLPKGFVSILSGGITDVQSKDPIDKALLQKKLQESTKQMRKAFPQNSPDVYPDGNYVVGTLFISRRKYLLPDLKTPNAGTLPDTRLFFQSLLRVVIGDKVLSWTTSDVDDAYNRRLAELEAVQNEFLGIA